ncbi:hypothetical protein GQX74_012401 [Glossina fuscipes]|nr:hypothetical protein GQX74_012401 [Glossina fuscipes]
MENKGSEMQAMLIVETCKSVVNISVGAISQITLICPAILLDVVVDGLPQYQMERATIRTILQFKSFELIYSNNLLPLSLKEAMMCGLPPSKKMSRMNCRFEKGEQVADKFILACTGKGTRDKKQLSN